MSQPTNHLNKYFELKYEFHAKVRDLDIAVQQSNRDLQKLISKAKNDEQLGDFLVKSAAINEQVTELILWNKKFLEEVVYDSKALDGAKVRNLLRDQLDMINMLYSQRETYINELKGTKGTA
jgi:hypothetical protein